MIHDPLRTSVLALAGCAVALLASGAASADVPLVLTGEGTLTAGSATLPWPADPKLSLTLGTQVRLTVKSASTDSSADPEIVDTFAATGNDAGFVVADASQAPILLGWSGRWTNRKGFLVQGSITGQRSGVISQSPPVIGLAGTAEVRGLSGRGRGIVVKGAWNGELNTKTGAIRLLLSGPAIGELGPPEVVCGEHTDENVAGELQPLMLREDGTANTDHFFGNNYPHPFPYSTNPPSSGPHAGSWLPETIYDTPQDDEKMVHNLEHGHVLVFYHPSVSPAIVARLRAVVGLFSADVVMAPRPANDVPVALSSWGRLLKHKEFDEAAVQDFIERNRGHGPECFN